MALHHTLPIYKAAYDLLGIIFQLAKNMPRDLRQPLGGRIRDEALSISILVFRANVATDKNPHLTELLERLQVIELTLRLARDFHVISTKQYAAAIALTDMVGKQANGWRKDSGARNAKHTTHATPAPQPVIGLQEQLSLG